MKRSILSALLVLALSCPAFAALPQVQPIPVPGNITQQVNLAGTVTNVPIATSLLTAYCFNNQASLTAFFQIFNVPAAQVVLGTTVPILQQLIPAGGSAPVYIPPTAAGAFAGAMSVAATTAPGGATGSASGVYCYETTK